MGRSWLPRAKGPPACGPPGRRRLRRSGRGPRLKSVAAQGLHDIVLDPDFARNRTLYFNYFAPPTGQTPGRCGPPNFSTTKSASSPWPKPGKRADRHGRSGKRQVERGWTAPGRHQVPAEGAERRIVIAPDGKLLITGSDFLFLRGGLRWRRAILPAIRICAAIFRAACCASTGMDQSARHLLLAVQLFPPPPSRMDFAILRERPSTRRPANYGSPIAACTAAIRSTSSVRAENHGRPNVSYGTQYDARRTDGRKNVPVGNGKSSMPGVEEPVYWWNPDIAPSGMMFYTGDLFPEMKEAISWLAGWKQKTW